MWWVALGAVSAVTVQQPSDALSKLGFKIAQPMSDKDRAALRARIDASLAKSGDVAFFDDVTDAYSGKVRHRGSGLVCPLGKKGQRIVSASVEAAECETRQSNAIYRTSVTRALAGSTLTSIEAAAQTAAEHEPHYAAMGGAHVEARPDLGSGRPEHRTLRFVSKVDGHDRASRVQVGLVRGWVLTERHEYAGTAVPPMGMADLLEETMFGSSIKPDGAIAGDGAPS